MRCEVSTSFQHIKHKNAHFPLKSVLLVMTIFEMAAKKSSTRLASQAIPPTPSEAPLKAAQAPPSRANISGDISLPIVSGMATMSLESARPVPLTRNTIVTEFARYFGSEDKLKNWQRLCRDVGIEDVPRSLKNCKQVWKILICIGFQSSDWMQALRNVWVNIYDLIVAIRQNKIPHRFPSRHALSAYTLRTRKIFPKERAKEGGPVRQLLAHIF